LDALEAARQSIRTQNDKWDDQRTNDKLIKMKDVGREGWQFWSRRHWTFQIQHDYPVKVLVLERIELVREGRDGRLLCDLPGVADQSGRSMVSHLFVGAYSSPGGT
jgi:hypothetical protein